MTQNTQLSLDEQFQVLLSEGVHDNGIFKAVFLAGGPGSGKDYVLKNTLAGHGLTEINSDKALEFLMDKHHLDKKMPESEEEARNHIRKHAKNLTELRQSLALKGRNGLIINGTGSDHKLIKKIKDGLEKHGYESKMLMVHSEDEVSRSRNIGRGQRGGRSVPEKVRKQKWDEVQESRRHHAKNFGDNYMEFDNSMDHQTATPEEIKSKKDELDQIHQHIHEFVNTPTQTEKSQKWIAKELVDSNKHPIPQKGTGQLPHPDSQAYAQAKEAGLQYYGHGRYGKNRQVTHYALNDNLTELEKEDPKKPTKKKLNEAVSITITGDTVEEINDLFANFCKKDTTEVTYKNHALTLGKHIPVYGKSNEGISLNNNDVKNITESIDIACNSQAQETLRRNKQSLVEPKTKLTLSTFRLKKESIDKGIEPGMSMDTLNRDTPANFSANSAGDLKRNKKSKVVKEMTGDETTVSISAQKEDETTKNGFSGTTLNKFKKKISESKLLNKETPTIEQISEKHKKSLEYMSTQLKNGVKIEMEHTDKQNVASEIALDHLNEDPDYYLKLKKYVE
jgi:hypothetical protein